MPTIPFRNARGEIQATAGKNLEPGLIAFASIRGAASAPAGPAMPLSSMKDWLKQRMKARLSAARVNDGTSVPRPRPGTVAFSVEFGISNVVRGKARNWSQKDLLRRRNIQKRVAGGVEATAPCGGSFHDLLPVTLLAWRPGEIIAQHGDHMAFRSFVHDKFIVAGPGSPMTFHDTATQAVLHLKNKVKGLGAGLPKPPQNFAPGQFDDLRRLTLFTIDWGALGRAALKSGAIGGVVGGLGGAVKGALSDDPNASIIGEGLKGAVAGGAVGALGGAAAHQYGGGIMNAARRLAGTAESEGAEAAAAASKAVAPKAAAPSPTATAAAPAAGLTAPSQVRDNAPRITVHDDSAAAKAGGFSGGLPSDEYWKKKAYGAANPPVVPANMSRICNLIVLLDRPRTAAGTFAGGDTAGSPSDMASAYGAPDQRPASVVGAAGVGAVAGSGGVLAAARMLKRAKRR